VSDTTMRLRRDEWIAAGVFDALEEEALRAYDKIWASTGLTDIHHQGPRPGKDVQNGDHGTEEAPSSSVVHPGVQG
jgi:hypothetical protein